jgi:hypothetical protein
MKKLIVILLALLFCGSVEAKDFAERYPTNTPMEVYTPGSPPPAPDLSAYYKLDGSNANGYLYLGSGMYLKAIDANTTGAYIHDTLVFHWEDIPVTPAAGTPIGLLLCLTYS